ncbi:MAG: methionine--tRNA ligase [Sphingomonadales bacterium]
MTDATPYYITTPIYYVNDAPHIGHAYTTLACDALARFKRLDGYDVVFLTGTDEHGQKVEKSARAAGVEPLEFCDRVSGNFRELAAAMNFSNDAFIRTTEDRHKKAAQALWNRLEERGQIYLDVYSGWYSVRDETFYAESELIKGANGEKLAPSGAPVEWVEEPSYFFRLSQWAEPLLEFYEKHPDFVGPETRRNEVISFVRGGLRDLSISRTSFKWGIPVPGQDDHVMYVWLDALTNYITHVGFGEDGSTDFARFWPADLNMIGKDILRHHAVYWPAFLLAAGEQPPARVFAHGWWTNEGQKISKSLGNVIDPLALIDEFGLDQLRYFLLREVPFGNDGDFSRRAFIGRINGDLANDFGNLAQRVLSMIAKNRAGRMPEPGAFTSDDSVLIEHAESLLETMREALDRQRFQIALQAIWRLIGDANSYVARQEPWALKKTDPARMNTVLYVAAEVVRHCAVLAQPFMPQACSSLLDQLGVPGDARDFTHLGERGRLNPGTALPKPQGVFPRHVEAA